MNRELRIAPRDVQAVRFPCRCGAAITLRPGHLPHDDVRCPQCREPLFPTETEWRAVRQFLMSLDALRQARPADDDTDLLELILPPSD